MIAGDEIKYTIERLKLIVNNSDSEVERFIAVQAINSLAQLQAGIANLENHPKLEDMASEFFKDEVNNDNT